MNQRNKNITLLVILGLLMITSIILGFTDGSTTNTITNKELFSIQDTSKIDQIIIKSTQENIRLSKIEGVWMLSEKTRAEPDIIKILLSILKDAEVTRDVPKSQQKEINAYIKGNGFFVELSENGQVINSFYACGNKNKTVSYMMDANSEKAFVVNIPGYGSYVAGIFEIPLIDWRDRLILSTNWRTLQKLNINYTEYPEYNLAIKFNFNFLDVEGVQALDTSRMMAFIDEFNLLQADRFLDNGQNEQYDSLLKTTSTVSLSIEDINPVNSKRIDFFPLLPDDPMMLGYVKEDEQMVLFNAQRIQQLFAVKDDFERVE
jgi:hypothetical protein